MPIPDYIDNQNHTLEKVLKSIIEEHHQLTLDIATGFFRIEAWLRLKAAMNQLNSFRLLIGRDPTIRPAESDRIDLVRYFRREIQQQLEQENFTSQYKKQIDQMISYLQQDHIQVRLYGANNGDFLHAKAYIFDNYSIVGSSNFTPAGLESNSELNVVNKIQAIASDLRFNWFERFWNDNSVDKEYKAKLIDALNASKFGSKAYTPYQVFLKVLYELFKDDTIIAEGDKTSLELANFQQEGFKRAINLIKKHNGCIVADAVGLGKTYIGLRLLEYYLIKERQIGKVPRALVICPAQLRDLVWNKKLDEFGIKANVLSHEEISRKTFDFNQYPFYDIIIIDESHNFRNSATNRYNNLLKLINSGKRNKRVVLLTATPINNSLFDLYHQIALITRGNDNYYQNEGISNLKSYFKELNQGEKEITELLFQTMVRRSRQDVIKRQEAGEEIRIAGKLIHFPKRQLEKFTYNFEESFAGLYSGIAYQIDKLNLAPYNIKAFKKQKDKNDENTIQSNYALVALQKALYLKRFESSLIAIKNSITNQRDFQAKFLQKLIENGKLLDSKNYRKMILAATDEEENNSSVDNIIESLEEINIKDYEFEQITEQIEADLKTLNQILADLEKIESETFEHQDYDRKLAAFKQLLVTELKGQKILVFSYFKDTANYLYNQLIQDEKWLTEMRGNGRKIVIELLTGATPGKQREEKVKRFSPKANTQTDEELREVQQNPIDILICTDVLSEGQNLQDAGVLVNYDLHWNPVRMIQRAGRIDRLGTDYDKLFIYNCFPEQGLEDLLGLVERLEQRIATIDREVGLDASVLGEVISEKSLEDLYRLKNADSDDQKEAILKDLEQKIDLISLEEMRFPLLEFLQKASKDIIEDIPFGIHSTWNKAIQHHHYKNIDGGIFLAFRVKTQHFWHFYPRINGAISLESNQLMYDKGTIFNWIKCQESDFKSPKKLPPVPFDNQIFPVLEKAVDNLLSIFQKQETAKKIKPKMSSLINKIYHALKMANNINPIYVEAKERIIQVISTVNSRSYERDIKVFWNNFMANNNINTLIIDIDEYFRENDQYSELEEPEPEPEPIHTIIQREDIQLVCYQWFKP